MSDKPTAQDSFGTGKRGVQIFSKWTFFRGGFGKGKKSYCPKCDKTSLSTTDNKCNVCNTIVEWRNK